MSYFGDRINLLSKLKKEAIGAEIGVWKGEFSRVILEQTKPQKLYLIDPWEFQSEYPERMYGGKIAKNQNDMDNIYRDVAFQFGERGDVEIVKKKSDVAMSLLPDRYLDWVYIDGNHHYEFVKNDLVISLKKVKFGGMITGDDYNWGKEYGYPVKIAVHDFVFENKIQHCLSIIGSSQFIIKL